MAEGGPRRRTANARGTLADLGADTRSTGREAHGHHDPADHPRPPQLGSLDLPRSGLPQITSPPPLSPPPRGEPGSRAGAWRQTVRPQVAADQLLSAR